jgi:hypothetical protein
MVVVSRPHVFKKLGPPVHMTCGGLVKPLALLEPAECLRCGERFSVAHELGVRILTYVDGVLQR